MGKVSLKILYNSYKRKAERRGLEFAITLTHFKILTKKPCYICNAPPSQSFDNSQPGQKEPYIYNGVDRINNNLGYVVGNVKPCCWNCNNMKGAMSLKEFKAHIGRIVRGLLG